MTQQIDPAAPDLKATGDAITPPDPILIHYEIWKTATLLWEALYELPENASGETPQMESAWNTRMAAWGAIASGAAVSVAGIAAQAHVNFRENCLKNAVGTPGWFENAEFHENRLTLAIWKGASDLAGLELPKPYHYLAERVLDDDSSFAN